MTYLKDVKHPYYCNDANYLAGGDLNHGVTEFGSWAEFYDEFGDADTDYNLVFRWDWKKPDTDAYDTEGEYGEPEAVPETDTLHLYYMMQRKGYFQVMLVQVTDDDESEVRKFLAVYAEKMRDIWAPFM